MILVPSYLLKSLQPKISFPVAHWSLPRSIHIISTSVLLAASKTYLLFARILIEILSHLGTSHDVTSLVLSSLDLKEHFFIFLHIFFVILFGPKEFVFSRCIIKTFFVFFRCFVPSILDVSNALICFLSLLFNISQVLKYWRLVVNDLSTFFKLLVCISLFPLGR